MFNMRDARTVAPWARADARQCPMRRTIPHFWHGEFDGLELASITPKLGAYFGASEGVLVVQAPRATTRSSSRKAT